MASRTDSQSAPPLRITQTVLHLALLGTLGWAVIGALFGVLGAGIGLVFALGIGLVVLVGLVYALFGVAWFETARVSGLYSLHAAPLTFERRTEPTFGGWLRALGRQLGSGRMWWALANFALASTLGTMFLFAVQSLAWAIALTVRPTIQFSSSLISLFLPFGEMSSAQARVAGGVAMLVSLALAGGLVLLHRTISIALIGGQAREAALRAEAQAAATQAQLAAVHAQQSAAQARESAEQREGAVRAADVERTRLERDLHDGVQPRLVSVGMTLGLAQQKIDTDPEGAKALITEAHTSAKAAITELRQLARGIHASVLDDRGLDAALSALASRSHVPVTVNVRMDGSSGGRVARAAETAVYFVIAECLTNAAKHSRANECRVTVRVRQEDPEDPASLALWARVEDDGIGGAQVQPGGGLDGISNRVLAAGGTIRIDSPIGGPTAVEVSVPCAF